MDKREVPAVGDVVTIPGESTDGNTRVGIVEEAGGYSAILGGHPLTLRSVTSAVTWTDTWDPDTMIVARVDRCDHEVTGGYVYTGDPAGSRSMALECVALHVIDGERTWFRGWDEERMEVEVTITGLTMPVIDRLADRPAPARDAVGALRACMAQYLDGAQEGRMSVQWHAQRDGEMLMLHHLAMVTLGLSEEAATVWLAEELQEMAASRG